MLKKIVLFSLFQFCLGGMLMAQRLHPFTSESESIESSGAKERIPYKHQISYYDYILPGEKPSEIKDSVSYFDIYFMLPIPVSEIGIRLISPVPDYIFANTGDVVSDNFEKQYKLNNQIHFDPMIILEQGFTDESDEFIPVHRLAENDNSKEVIPQPSGKFNNAQVRTVSKSSFPSGIYRVRITTNNKDSVISGSYLMTIGLVPGLKNIKISRILNEVRP